MKFSEYLILSEGPFGDLADVVRKTADAADYLGKQYRYNTQARDSDAQNLITQRDLNRYNRNAQDLPQLTSQNIVSQDTEGSQHLDNKLKPRAAKRYNQIKEWIQQLAEMQNKQVATKTMINWYINAIRNINTNNVNSQIESEVAKYVKKSIQQTVKSFNLGNYVDQALINMKNLHPIQ